MKKGRGKQKGSAFERDICKRLSLWVTDGERKDCFWRSALSGGRATVSKGEVRQAGDICSVSSEGHSLTDRYYIECKSYADLQMQQFILHGKGKLSAFWLEAIKQSKKYNRLPILIAKQNLYPPVFISRFDILGIVEEFGRDSTSVIVRNVNFACSIYLLDEVLSLPYRSKTKRIKI